ncbi:heterogeneous nuclear ribonucleoprotein L-like isoform 2-T2 [Polymixia lowei]
MSEQEEQEEQDGENRAVMSEQEEQDGENRAVMSEQEEQDGENRTVMSVMEEQEEQDGESRTVMSVMEEQEEQDRENRTVMSVMEEQDEEEQDGAYRRAAKRLKTEDGQKEDGQMEDSLPVDCGGTDGRRVSVEPRSGRKEGGEEIHHMAPSLVVHVRGLCEAVVEADLVKALEKFGNICYVMMMPFKRQALVEFDGLESAARCVVSGTSQPVYIMGQQAFFNYSTSKRITRPTNADDPTSGNKVLLLSIQNPLYPITTDVLYTVCNPIGNVVRIVIFKRNRIQAMVEFESVENAQKAKLTLNGADIYAGCCTLKIEYARPSQLNVVRNDNSSWDYTKPFLLCREQRKGRQRPAILGDHPSSFGDNGYGSHCPMLPLPSNSRYQRSRVEVPEVILPPLASSYLGQASSSVAMVKFMKSVPETALVEMGDEYAVDRAITHLNSIKLFSKRLNVCVSKQHAVIPSQVFELEDGTSSYKDFAMTRNNRFSSVGQASKNIIQPPAAVLHFYNVPPCSTQEQLHRLCIEHNVPAFIKFKVFDAKPSSKTISGLLEFGNRTQAVEVLTILNHHHIRIPNGSNPYTLKLCFSTSSHL